MGTRKLNLPTDQRMALLRNLVTSFLENGRVVDQGFVEELKEKYILVKGEMEDIEAAKKVLYSISVNRYGFEGICLAQNLDKLAGMDIMTEQPTLNQITVAIMKANTKMQG